MHIKKAFVFGLIALFVTSSSLVMATEQPRWEVGFAVGRGSGGYDPTSGFSYVAMAEYRLFPAVGVGAGLTRLHARWDRITAMTFEANVYPVTSAAFYLGPHLGWFSYREVGGEDSPHGLYDIQYGSHDQALGLHLGYDYAFSERGSVGLRAQVTLGLIEDGMGWTEILIPVKFLF